MKRTTKIGCLAVTGVLAGVLVALVIVGYVALRAVANAIPMDAFSAPAAAPGQEETAEAGEPPPATGWEMVRRGLADGGTSIGSLLRGDLRFQVPDALWQSEVRKIFPIEEGLAGLVSVRIFDPLFLADSDPTRLRLHLGLNARMLDGDVLSFPGRISVRTRLRFVRSSQSIVLTDAELVDFSFTGEAAEVAADLRDVLAESIAAELEGFEVFQFPKGGEWWVESGKAMVKDVVVQNGRIVVIAGW